MTFASDDIAALDLPPLLTACPLPPGQDPMASACAAAARGCDAGEVHAVADPDRVRLAIVLAPETPLRQAMAALPACGVALQNTLGALCPPEMAVHLDWSGAVLVNGAECGRLRARASTADPAAVPDWLVVGADLVLLPADPENPGRTPERTALTLEGGGEVGARDLIESWSRHMLMWITRLEDAEGRALLHRHWTALAWRLQEEIALPAEAAHDGAITETGQPAAAPVPGVAAASATKPKPTEPGAPAPDQTAPRGTFLGLDEDFGMLLRSGGAVRLFPLTLLLQRT